MKKLIFILAALITLAGCSKESPKKYALIYDAEVMEGMSVHLEEYDNNNRCVAINTIEHIRAGYEEDFRSSPYAEYVIVRIDVDTEYINTTFYVANIFYLTNKKTIIQIDGKTTIQADRP